MKIDANQLRDLADAILAKHQVPGAALSIVKNGEVVFRHLHGVTSLDSKQPMTERAMFDIGSISKTFNAATMALLVDDGLLDWDDYVIDRLPGWRLIDPTVTPHAQLRDLVGQSLGLGEDNITNYFSHFTRQQIIDQIRHLPLRVPFRSECTYQSYGPVSAGAIVERLSGQSWEDFVEQRIAQKLGFSDTFASYFRLRDTRSACDPHFVQEDGKCVTIPHRNFDNLAPAGSMVSSLRDLERWFTLFAQKGELDGKRFLKAETVEQMLRPRTAVQPDGIHPQRYLSRFEASFVTYGLGFYAHDFGGRRINEHTGALEGFFVLGCAIPSENTAILVLTNQHVCPAVHTLRYLLLAAALGLPQQDWEARYAAAAKISKDAKVQSGEPYFWHPTFRDPKLASALSPDALVGAYEHPGFGRVTVSADSKALSVDLFGNDCRLDHWHGDLYGAVPKDQVMRSLYDSIYVSFTAGSLGARPTMFIPAIGEFRAVA